MPKCPFCNGSIHFKRDDWVQVTEDTFTHKDCLFDEPRIEAPEEYWERFWTGQEERLDAEREDFRDIR